MHTAHEFLKAIAVVLCVAAVTTVVFQHLRLPVVLGYILAGVIVGPYVPIPLVADRGTVQGFSEFGVILLMFSLGLEFSLRKLMRVGPTAGLTAVIETSIMVCLGFTAAQAFGWTSRESIFAGAIVAISSTTIVAKAFNDQSTTGKLREFVLGILIVEDLIAIMLMTIVTAISSGDGMSLVVLAKSSGRLVAFLTCLVYFGMLLVPRIVRGISRLNRPEISLVASLGICFGIALLAHEFGYSVALGAFIAGSLIAESGEGEEIERLIFPVRDVFAAIFFVSVGMMIDPEIVARHWLAVTVFTGVVIVGKFAGVSIGAFLTGKGTRTSVQAGMSLAQIGEFSFIIAGLGLSLNATRDFLYPIAVAVSALTTLTTPWLMRAATPVATFVDRKLPHPVQTFAALYGTWVEQLGASPDQEPATSAGRRLVRLLALDSAALTALVIAAATSTTTIAHFASSNVGLSFDLALALVTLGVIIIAIPLLVGIFRIVRGLGLSIAQAALPAAATGEIDLAAAPRRALVVALQLAIVLVVALPVLALTQPFIRGWVAAMSFGTIVVLFGLAFWSSTVNLDGHVRAGAEMILEALLTHAKQVPAAVDRKTLDQIKHLTPGLGSPVPLRLDERSAAVGKTLAQLNLRGLTGATVLALARGEQKVLVPTANEILRGGDILALAGTQEAVAAAMEILRRNDDEPVCAE